MVITAREALSIQSARESPDDIATEFMVDRVDKTIRICSQQGLQCAQIIIPQWLPTVPIFDRAVVNQKVMNVFRRNGFGVHPDESGFSVTWGAPKRSSVPSSMQQQQDEDEDSDDEVTAATSPEPKSTVRVISAGRPASTGAVRLINVKNSSA
jgi:hypothetical protein